MVILDEIKKIAEEIGGSVKEEKGIYVIDAVIAERKAFLSKKKLSYIAKMRVNDEEKLIKFTEMLKEAGSGLSMGSGDNMSPGFGFKSESYNTMGGGREGSIQEQSNLFGKNYTYNFDYAKVRKAVEELAKKNGYKFNYQVTPIGL